MNAFKSLIVGLPLFSLFAGSFVRADDCRDALTAESCACQSAVRKDSEPSRTSAKRSSSNRQSRPAKSAGRPLAQRAKKNMASLEETSPER